MFSPEFGQKGNELVKRQEVELDSGGALKQTAQEYLTTRVYCEKNFVGKIIGFEANYTKDCFILVVLCTANAPSLLGVNIGKNWKS